MLVLSWASSIFRLPAEDLRGSPFVKNNAAAHTRLCAMAAGRRMVTGSAEPGLWRRSCRT